MFDEWELRGGVSILIDVQPFTSVQSLYFPRQEDEGRP